MITWKTQITKTLDLLLANLHEPRPLFQARHHTKCRIGSDRRGAFRRRMAHLKTPSPGNQLKLKEKYMNRFLYIFKIMK